MKKFKEFNEEVYQPNIDNTTTPPDGKDDSYELGEKEENIYIEIAQGFNDTIREAENQYPEYMDDHYNKVQLVFSILNDLDLSLDDLK